MPAQTLPYGHVYHRFYSLVMMVLLLWLTVCTPYVYDAQQQMAMEQTDADGCSENAGPFSNATEEKAEGGTNSLSEYLQEVHHALPPESMVLSTYKSHPDDLYSAFHPELLSPPPEGLL